MSLASIFFSRVTKKSQFFSYKSYAGHATSIFHRVQNTKLPSAFFREHATLHEDHSSDFTCKRFLGDILHIYDTKIL